MPEMIEEQESKGFDISRFWGIVRRRHLEFLIPLFLGWLLIWGSSWVIPPRYKSSTLIIVEQPTMPQNYVVPNINDDLQTRLQSMTEQILSRTRLLVIIQKLHLYGGERSELTDDQKIASMRKDINLDLVRDPQKQDISSFTISYEARDPHLAQKVTAELTELFINENLRVRQEESEGTTDFLEKQLEDARQSLSEQEAKVQEFESQHEGALPTQESSNLAILNGLQSQLQSEQDALNTAKQQRVYLEALLEQERTAQVRVRPGGDQANAAPTDLATIDDQLDKLRAQLAELSSRYTDRYPDVLRLKDQIAKTEAMRDNLIAAQKSAAAGSHASDDSGLGPTGRQVQSQLQANQVEIANRESSIESLKARLGEYQGRLNMTPATEQELDDLTRGYDQSKANYDDLLKKKDQSEMATSMEQMQQGERFTILDPPSLPSKPDFPKRLEFCGIGLCVGLLLGSIVAGGLEFFDDRLHSEEEIKALLPMGVLSDIPRISNAEDEQKAKRRLTLGWAATAVVFVTILAGSVFSFLHS
jgi:polysaccharide chain length determinant protein (PEP-CTERM system associated)